MGPRFNPQFDVWDVVVLGGGPSGAVAAYLLARAGLRVAIVDKSSGPRYKVCGGCLNGRGVALLKHIRLEHIARRALRNPLQRIVFHRNSREVTLSGPAGAIIDRAEFDAALLEEAQTAGVAVYAESSALVEPLSPASAECGTGRTAPFRRVHLYRGGVAVGALHAKVIIAADGLGRPSLRRLTEFTTVTQVNSRFGVGVEPNAPLQSDGYAPNTLHMGVADDGYLGVARLVDGRLCIAAAVDRAVLQGEQPLGQWLAQTIRANKLPDIDGLAVAAIRGTRPLTQRPARVAGHRVLLVGDAAGYTEPITGEGMAWALAAAAALPPIALAACREWSPEQAAAWQRTLRREVYGAQLANRILASAMRRPAIARGVFAAASSLPKLCLPIMRQLNRPRFPARTAA